MSGIGSTQIDLVHKPILPKMPEEGECVKFDAWQNTQRHPITIYVDFETLLVKTNEEKGKKL